MSCVLAWVPEKIYQSSLLSEERIFYESSHLTWRGNSIQLLYVSLLPSNVAIFIWSCFLSLGFQASEIALWWMLCAFHHNVESNNFVPNTTVLVINKGLQFCYCLIILKSAAPGGVCWYSFCLVDCCSRRRTPLLPIYIYCKTFKDKVSIAFLFPTPRSTLSFINNYVRAKNFFS